MHCIEEEKNDGVGKVARSSNDHELKMGIGNFIAQQLQQLIGSGHVFMGNLFRTLPFTNASFIEVE